ncbi:phosphatidate cytidylyltransferase [Mucilaginibacter pineti]|uniref:Phosphatidate cytidylyltransferase n=1 Tax=Mucilaginibacter pineti TaxID=1391627 RepID=A0A1G7FMZ5_9SPHI|nr:phosphatidate cytidylyltransferase [Mucilaginibacter pineti]SDE77209.1 phosphatidate cytidylyltransferase [Mucilaginibacter pineti]
MRLRAITGFFFIIVMVGSVLLGSFVFSLFYLALSAFCLFEFYKLIKQNTAKPNVPIGLLNAVLLFTAFALFNYASFSALPGLSGKHMAFTLLFLLPLTSGAILMLELFKKSTAPFNNIAYTYFGIIFAVVPFIFFHALAFVGGSFNFHIPLAFLIMLWANDTGAYVVGSQIGRVKLFERHSPKKTYEGLIGGIVISAGAALILGHYYQELSWKQWVTIAILISCFGTMGDLVESMFKRSINVKDSGGILPGHGGLLDRFDGLLLAAPIVYAYLYFISN